MTYRCEICKVTGEIDGDAFYRSNLHPDGPVWHRGCEDGEMVGEHWRGTGRAYEDDHELSPGEKRQSVFLLGVMTGIFVAAAVLGMMQFARWWAA